VAIQVATLGGMESWTAPEVPTLPGSGPPLALFDSARRSVQQARPDPAGARMYVCGITPYDATPATPPP
jgi:L-cysteine:1D-myo-inositol 2-amino-2-deoxy-alpha-D-glucopyranoside ligase